MPKSAIQNATRRKNMDSACTAVQSLDVSHRFSHDNLHICFTSRFDPPQADVLIKLLQQYYQSCKRIFIDVREVKQPNPAAVAILKTAFLRASYAPQQIVFKGNSGFALAISGNKVLLVPEKKPEGHVCRGNCAHCRCGHKKAHSESRTA